ncbi:MAG: hypothetical protein HYS22_01680 [Deltaproteobacteria bacterium]|nr:hypothetical protein [Deltaproteobacteria bacterium]
MKRKMLGFLIVAVIFLASCGGSGSSGGTDTGSTATEPKISSALKLATQTSPQASTSEATQALVGQATATGLQSMKYYITSITICEKIDTSGSAYNNPTGCLELYKGNQSDSRYTYTLDQDFAPFGDVARGSDDGFVDLIDDTSRATLKTDKTLTTADVRSYNYGYINWYLPVKLKAEVTMADGTTYRTADGTTATVDSNQGPMTTATDDFSMISSAKEAVVVLGNGGSWFRFQNPFVITQADIDNNVQFALDLTFNPEGLIKAYSPGLGGCGSCILKDTVGNQLLVPMISLTPVPHKTSESVTKETYMATVSSGADNFDIRLEFYSVQGDLTKTIYGVDTATLINSKTTTAVSPFSKVSFVKTGSDGNLELQDYRGTTGPLLTKFQRQTEVGTSFTATLHCTDSSQGGFTFDGCSNTTQEVTFTLQSVEALK